MEQRKAKIYKQALEVAEPIKEIHHFEAEKFFCKKNKFESEEKFTSDLLTKIPSLIKQIYDEDIKSIRLESSYDQKFAGYFKVRADIDILCVSGKRFIIECKNPIHDKSEILNAIGQMIGYQMVFDNMNEDITIILATSIYKFYMTEAIKKHNIEIDIILNNSLGTAFLLNKELI